MASNTINYNLVKPTLNETADIEVINNNMDIIDTKLKEVEEATNNVEVPVKRVNGKTGEVVLSAKDINTADGTSLEKFKTDTNIELEQKMNRKITDDATTKKYELGINNGLLYYKEVIE